MSPQLLLQEAALPVAEHEGQEGEDQGVQDADDGQDVGPAHRAAAQDVPPRVLPTHVPDHLRVPAVWKDHAADHQTHGWSAEEEVRRSEETKDRVVKRKMNF
uniref:Uncharacterized protein n=1 Tax=Gasterosteus aculeatus TaxID=69293 RepID=G3PBP1_GASAC